jgi:ubiquitin-conjugating enzyme E2 R
MAEKILMNEYKALSKETWTNISMINDNVFEWSVALIVLNPDSNYYGGYFKATMKFPKNYPYSPPDFRFVRPLWHPNVYPDGRLCISILHAPGEDATSGELASERWSPAQRVESVLLSVLSLLDDAEVSSPANVDAGVQLRKDPAGYKARVLEDTEKSKEDIPEGFEMPTHESAFKKEAKPVDDFSWSDSEAEDDFGGSDTDEDMVDDLDEDDTDAEPVEDDDDEA